MTGSYQYNMTNSSYACSPAPSPAAVRETSERAGIPCERVMHSIWLEPEHEPARAQTTALRPTLR